MFESWFYLIEFLDKVNSVYAKVRALEKRTGFRFTASVKGSPAKNILKWSEANNFRQNLIECTDGFCEYDKAKAICDNFVSIRKPIYLVNALTAVRYIGYKGKRLAKRVAAKVIEENNMLKSWLKGRKLSLAWLTRPAAKVTSTLKQSAIWSLNSLADAAKNIAAATQVITFNPLLCTDEYSCEADKVVLTVSQCGTTLYQCTKDYVFFDFDI